MPDTVKVKLDWSYGYQGRTYGPGAAVAVPQGLADALGLKPVDESGEQQAAETTNERGQSLPPIRALVAHLQTLATPEQVNALAAIDTRASATPLYAARLAELEAK